MISSRVVDEAPERFSGILKGRESFKKAVSNEAGLDSLVLSIDGSWYRLITTCDICIPDSRRLNNTVAGAGTPT